MTVRQFLVVTHRWIGLCAAIVLAVAGATGAVMVWDAGGVIQRVAGRLHETLALGRIGAAVVTAATAGALLLQCSGVILWWKRKTVTVRLGRGWKPALVDLHYAAGIFGLVLMILLSATALGMKWLPHGPDSWSRTIGRIHTARTFPAPVKFIWAVGSLGFLVQGVTGVSMWWNRTRP
jgi:uncharacterized iron-regulated membrane protein